MKHSGSRPITAKLLSPKAQKNREGKDLDVNQLCDAMYFPLELDKILSASRSNAKPKESMLKLKHLKEKQKL